MTKKAPESMVKDLIVTIIHQAPDHSLTDQEIFRQLKEKLESKGYHL